MSYYLKSVWFCKYLLLILLLLPNFFPVVFSYPFTTLTEEGPWQMKKDWGFGISNVRFEFCLHHSRTVWSSAIHSPFVDFSSIIFKWKTFVSLVYGCSSSLFKLSFPLIHMPSFSELTQEASRQKLPPLYNCLHFSLWQVLIAPSQCISLFILGYNCLWR